MSIVAPAAVRDFIYLRIQVNASTAIPIHLEHSADHAPLHHRNQANSPNASTAASASNLTPNPQTAEHASRLQACLIASIAIQKLGSAPPAIPASTCPKTPTVQKVTNANGVMISLNIAVTASKAAAGNA